MMEPSARQRERSCHKGLHEKQNMPRSRLILKPLVFLLAILWTGWGFPFVSCPLPSPSTPTGPLQATKLPSRCISLGSSNSRLSPLIQAVSLHPSAKAYNALGTEYVRVSKLDCAVESFRAALDLDPHFWQAHFNLGLAFMRQQNFKAAAKEFQETVEEQPNHGEAYDALGVCLHALRDEPAATRAFASALRSNPRLGKAAFHLAEVLSAERRYESSIYYFKQALALARQGDLAGEEAELEAAVREDSTFSKAQNQLGVCYMARGRLADAEREFKAALQQDPGNALAENNLGVLYGKEGRNAEALALFERATIDNPRYVEAFFNWGLILASAGKYAEAISKFQQALTLDPHYSRADTALKMAEAAQKRNGDAHALRHP
jgi:tetratricopeptide (TPR) repeat protein